MGWLFAAVVYLCMSAGLARLSGRVPDNVAYSLCVLGVGVGGTVSAGSLWLWLVVRWWADREAGAHLGTWPRFTWSREAREHPALLGLRREVGLPPPLGEGPTHRDVVEATEGLGRFERYYWPEGARSTRRALPIAAGVVAGLSAGGAGEPWWLPAMIAAGIAGPLSWLVCSLADRSASGVRPGRETAYAMGGAALWVAVCAGYLVWWSYHRAEVVGVSVHDYFFGFSAACGLLTVGASLFAIVGLCGLLIAERGWSVSLIPARRRVMRTKRQPKINVGPGFAAWATIAAAILWLVALVYWIYRASVPR